MIPRQVPTIDLRDTYPHMYSVENDYWLTLSKVANTVLLSESPTQCSSQSRQHSRPSKYCQHSAPLRMANTVDLPRGLQNINLRLTLTFFLEGVGQGGGPGAPPDTFPQATDTFSSQGVCPSTTPPPSTPLS
jgi:hypothetical protein